jgi:hypothetical protein
MPQFVLPQICSALHFRRTLKEDLPIYIIFRRSITILFAFWTVARWSGPLLEHHAHFDPLSRREAKFPVHLEINIPFRDGILYSKVSSFNHISSLAHLFKVDLENGNQGLYLPSAAHRNRCQCDDLPQQIVRTRDGMGYSFQEHQ